MNVHAIVAKAYADVQHRLEQWVNNLPEGEKDRPIVGLAGSGETLTPRDLVRHVEQRTPRGDKIVANWLRLAVNQTLDNHLGPS